MTLDPTPPPSARPASARPPSMQLSALAGATARTSEDYFRWVAEWLQRETEASHVVVGELSGEDWDRVRTVVFRSPDGVEENVEYDLSNTPCAYVVGKNPCAWASGVAEEFPEDTFLSSMGIQSYVGVPLKNSAGLPLGLMVLLHTRIIDDAYIVDAKAAIARFRPRAEEELEKRRNRREYKALLGALSTPRGDDVLASLLTSMVHVLRMRDGWVVTEQSTGAGTHLCSIASTLPRDGGGQLDFDPVGTPCENRAECDLSLWSEDARRSFPGATFLHARGAEACLTAAITAADGRPLGWVVLVHDRAMREDVRTQPLLETFLRLMGAEIERAERLRAQRRMDKKLQDTQRVEGLGLLAGGIAHDFNNLLAAILGNTELAIEDVEQGSAAYTRMRTVESAALRASDLCRQLLDYAGRREPVVLELDLGKVVREMTDLLRTSIPTNVEFRFRLSQSGLVVRADPGQVRQVVMNLISNGVEAMAPEGGTLEIRTGHRSRPASPNPRAGPGEALQPGPYALLEVNDTGSGMSPDTLARIFEPFFTTKEGGHGLGLAAVQGILRRHGGAIEIDSAPGEGTSCRVLLPTAGSLPPPEATEPRSRKGTILLADDQEMVLEVARTVLERAGFRVLAAQDGQQALQLARDYAGTIDCAVLDLAMPELDGLDCVRALRVDRPGLPSVIVSGYLAHGLENRVLPGELQGTVEKPFRGSTLVEVVQGAIAALRD